MGIRRISKQKTPRFISTLGLYASQHFNGWGVKRAMPSLVATRLKIRESLSLGVIAVVTSVVA